MQVPKMVFLYKLAPGAAGASFGLNVALMAGLPPSVVARASVLAGTGLRPVPPAHVSSGGDAVPAELLEATCGQIKAACHGRGQALEHQTDLMAVLHDVMVSPSDQNGDSLVALQGRVKQALGESV